MNRLESGVLTRDDPKAGDRQVEGLGQQAQAGLVGAPPSRSPRRGASSLAGPTRPVSRGGACCPYGTSTDASRRSHLAVA